MKFLIKLSYDGSKFYGFQRLNQGVSIQSLLEQALTKINKKEVLVKGAGRTDRGVHAKGQCASFSLDIKIDETHLKKALNSLLGDYIYVTECKTVDEDFHARFSVKNKKYTYKINLGEYNPIEADYVYQCPYNLDIKKLKKCSKLFIGGHDFRNFVSGSRDDYKSIIYKINVNKKNDILEITFIGKSFYRYMVRNIVGALIEVGRGKAEFNKVKQMLNNEIKADLFTAPACGLYLDDINY